MRTGRDSTFGTLHPEYCAPLREFENDWPCVAAESCRHSRVAGLEQLSRDVPGETQCKKRVPSFDIHLLPPSDRRVTRAWAFGP